MKWVIALLLPIFAYADDFLWGVAISEYQNSGADTVSNCQWAKWESLGNPYILGAQTSGQSVNHYHNYETHIDMLEELGVNSFRFSIEWALVEPEEGVFDESVLEHYLEEILALKERGIKPMLTLHHFTDPLWFADLGGWEEEANIHFFTRYCEKVFSYLHDEVELWCLINEPNAYAFMGYFLGEFPPGIKNPQMMGEVLCNMLKAHVATYQVLKPIDPKAQIGFVHAYLTFEPYHSWNFIETLPCNLMTHIFNEGELKFFKEGCFEFNIPLVASVSHEDVQALLAYDFIGLNFYSRAVLSMAWNTDILVATCKQGEYMTDMPFPMYPQGLYNALLDLSTFGKPIYVTENGAPDHKDKLRSDWIKGYLGALERAINEGVDVRGYYYWTLVDNFEWAEGWNMEFGLFKKNDNGTFQLKEGARAYQSYLEKQKSLVIK